MIVVQWVSQHVWLGFWEEVVPSTTHQVYGGQAPRIRYGGTQHHLGGVGTKKEAGMAYDRVAIAKRTEEVSYMH